MKKTLFTLFTAINLALLYCPAAFALTEDEVLVLTNILFEHHSTSFLSASALRTSSIALAIVSFSIWVIRSNRLDQSMAL